MLARQLLAFCLLHIGTLVSTMPAPPAKPAVNQPHSVAHAPALPVGTPPPPAPALPAPQPIAPVHPAGEFDADHQKIYVRFQIPRAGQTTNQALVRELNWASTVASVTATCENFVNHGGQNDMLWFEFKVSALQYAGLYSPPWAHHMSPQSGLAADNVAVSFILPSGVKRLKEVFPDTSGEKWNSQDREAVRLIRGIAGVLKPADYAYTTVGNIKAGILEAKNEFKRNSKNSLKPDPMRLRIGAAGSLGHIVPISLTL